jgi:hypothetical protein
MTSSMLRGSGAKSGGEGLVSIHCRPRQWGEFPLGKQATHVMSILKSVEGDVEISQRGRFTTLL